MALGRLPAEAAIAALAVLAQAGAFAPATAPGRLGLARSLSPPVPVPAGPQPLRSRNAGRAPARRASPQGAAASAMSAGAEGGTGPDFWLWSGSSAAPPATSHPDKSLPRVIAVAAAFLGPFIFGIALGFTSPCGAPMAADVGLSTMQRSAFASIINLGAVCSGLFGMRYVETLGRKPCLLITGALYAGGFGAIATCVSLPALLGGRFLTGLAAGLATVVTPCYIAEISPASMRGTLGSLYQLFCTLGILAAYGLGEIMSWRDLAAFTSILSIVVVVLCQAVLPETASWLKMAGRPQEARAWQSRLGLPLDHEAAGEASGEPAPDVAAEGRASLQALRRPLTLIASMMVLQQMSGINSILFFSCEILGMAGLGDDAALGAVMIGLAQCAGTAISLRTVDRLGRRTLLHLSSLGMTLGMGVLAAFFLARDTSMALLSTLFGPAAAAAALVVFIFAFSLGWGPVPWVMVAELFPPSSRATATAMSTVLTWGGSFVITQFFLVLIEMVGSSAVFTGFVGVCAFMVAWVGIQKLSGFVETKGRSLEQIQDDLSLPARS